MLVLQPIEFPLLYGALVGGGTILEGARLEGRYRMTNWMEIYVTTQSLPLRDLGIYMLNECGGVEGGIFVWFKNLGNWVEAEGGGGDGGGTYQGHDIGEGGDEIDVFRIYN